MPAVAASNRRIVLEHRSGVMKGIFNITGLESDAPRPLPDYNPEVMMRDHVAPVCLVAVRPRFVLYREVVTPEMQNGKTFNEAQR